MTTWHYGFLTFITNTEALATEFDGSAKVENSQNRPCNLLKLGESLARNRIPFDFFTKPSDVGLTLCISSLISCLT